MAELRHGRTGRVIADAVELAGTRATRRRGLLGRDGLDSSAALLIWPCFAVHTAFMRFPIDVVFVNRRGTVVRVAEHLTPWRVAAAAGARAVIELPAGAVKTHGVAIGDPLTLRAAAAPTKAPVWFEPDVRVQQD